MRYERSVDIDAPPVVVWPVLADLEHWPDWTASMRRLTRLEPGPLAVGSTTRVEQPRLPKTVWTVTELEPGVYFTWEATSPGVRTVASHRVDPRGDAGSTVTLWIEQGGPLSPLVGRLMGGLTRRYVDLETAGIKTFCERGPHAPGTDAR